MKAGKNRFNPAILPLTGFAVYIFLRPLLDGLTHYNLQLLFQLAVTAAAAEALRQPFVNQGGLRLERIGFRQPAAPLGRFDPANFGAALYAKHLRGKAEDGQWLDIWPWPLYPVRRSAVLQVWKTLETRAAGNEVVILDCPPDEYSPVWNNSDGTPSEQGVALAALATALTQWLPHDPAAAETTETV